MWQVFIIWLPDTYWRPLVCVHVSSHHRYTDIHYKLLSAIFKLKHVRTLLNLLQFWECTNVCKTLKRIMFAIEAPISAKKLPQVVINWNQIKNACYHPQIGNHSKIQGYPYPQSSCFSHLTIFCYIRPRTSFNVLLWVYVCMFMWITYMYCRATESCQCHI